MTSVDAPYLSPILRYDPVARIVIIAHRDPRTGEISSQVPSEPAIKREQQAARQEAAIGRPGLSLLV